MIPYDEWKITAPLDHEIFVDECERIGDEARIYALSIMSEWPAGSMVPADEEAPETECGDRLEAQYRWHLMNMRLADCNDERRHFAELAAEWAVEAWADNEKDVTEGW